MEGMSKSAMPVNKIVDVNVQSTYRRACRSWEYVQMV
jgi:hypothetical protein